VSSCLRAFVFQILRAFLFQILRSKNINVLNNSITKKIIQLRKVLLYSTLQLAFLHDIPTQNFGFNGSLQYRIRLYQTSH
jgi:hypothetical protein